MKAPKTYKGRAIAEMTRDELEFAIEECSKLYEQSLNEQAKQFHRLLEIVQQKNMKATPQKGETL